MGSNGMRRARPRLMHQEESLSPKHPITCRAEDAMPFPTFFSPCVGYYMFIEASRPRVTGDKARLISPLYNITAKYYCVSFYYHMYGKHIGEYCLGMGSPGLVQGVRGRPPHQLHQLWLQPAIWVAESHSVLRAPGWSSESYSLPAPSMLWGCPWNGILKPAITPCHVSSRTWLLTLHKKKHHSYVHVFLLVVTIATLL